MSPAPTPAPTTAEIVERMIEKSRVAAERQKLHGMSYTRHTVVEELDAKAAVRERRTRDHAVTSMRGETRMVLLRQDGKAQPSKEHGADEEREAEHRKAASQRRGKPQGPDFLDAALVRRFDYEPAGEETLDGRRAFVLRFEPKPGATDTGEMADRFIGLLHGRIWIDAEEFEVVKVDSHLKSTLSVLGGLAATVTRLDFIVERARVAPGLWMNRRLLSYAEGRKVLMSFRMRMDVLQDDFREVPLKPAAP